MPAKLPEDCVKITVRVPVRDLELLNLAHPRQVNEVIRRLVGGYVERLRERTEGSLP